MTTKFESAAALMSRVLGADGYPFALIEHPISSATEAELALQAHATVEQGLAILSGQKS
ncbi:MAG: hypothetical protein O3B08_03225 [Proteobacteria bacterium]|nr:hypothetical protein [Pseudomonadota bacterium]